MNEQEWFNINKQVGGWTAIYRVPNPNFKQRTDSEMNAGIWRTEHYENFNVTEVFTDLDKLIERMKEIIN